MVANSQPRRLLIVTYYWPPSGGSGVQRWLKFAKYLPRHGWQPVVVAPLDADYEVFDRSLAAEIPPEAEVIRVPIREPYAAYRKLTGARPGESPTALAPSSERPGLLKRLSLWVRANLFVPDPKILWVTPTVRHLRSYLSEHPVDAIVTTGPPHSVHLIGERLASEGEVPWLMDVRDPWSQFDVHLSFRPGARARRKNRALERRCLAASTRILSTAPSMPDHLEPFDQSKFRTITNGYDEADFGGGVSSAVERTDGRFVLLHTGVLSAVRNPAALWRALAQLCGVDAGFAERLTIRLVGAVDPEVRAAIRAYPELRGALQVEGWLPHAEVLAEYGRASCLLLCPTQSRTARSQINGKLFEYLAARRPVLHIGPYDADNTRLIDEAHAGLTVVPGDVDGARDAIERIASGRFTARAYAFEAAVIERYSRAATAAKLVAELNEVT